MAYKLEISKQIVKFLDKSEHQLKIKIITAFEQLSNNPRSASLDIKAMINKKGHFRLVSENIVFYMKLQILNYSFMFIKRIVEAMYTNLNPCRIPMTQ
ncbi:MAG: hypothetical protein WCK96_01960 [Methylococcales bacterium]